LKGEAGVAELMKVCDVLNKCGIKVNKNYLHEKVLFERWRGDSGRVTSPIRDRAAVG
jgi:hypothetical protein